MHQHRLTAAKRMLVAVATAAAAIFLLLATPAGAQVPGPETSGPTGPAAPTVTVPSPPSPGDSAVKIDFGDDSPSPSNSVGIIVLLTLLSVAPALLIMMTSFTRIVIVLSLTRNALGLQGVPPNQVLAGLALFLSLFVMAPTLKAVNEDAVQPYLKGDMKTSEALEVGAKPIHKFMVSQTRKSELALFIKEADLEERPAKPEDVPMQVLVPAFILSELKTAFIIGFIIFLPFMLVDLVVSSSMMSLGMMMLPPVVVSLPLKILLFVMVDGWALVVRSLLASFG